KRKFTISICFHTVCYRLKLHGSTFDGFFRCSINHCSCERRVNNWFCFLGIDCDSYDPQRKNKKRVSKYSTILHSFTCLKVNNDKCQRQLNLILVGKPNRGDQPAFWTFERKSNSYAFDMKAKIN